MISIPSREVLAGSWRRWWSYDAPDAGPRWLQALWTLVLALVLTVGFTLLWFVFRADGAADWLNPGLWLKVLGENLVMSMIIGFLIHGMFLAIERGWGLARIRALQGWRRSVFLGGVPMVGVMLGWPLGFWLVTGQPPFKVLSATSLIGTLVLALLVSLLFQLIWASESRAISARMQATEAQLKLLQAQIEPHFLFNTLANVLSLVDADPPRAKAMLEAFIDFLRTSLQQQRRGSATLDEELALAEAYLQLMAMRMGERLQHTVQATPEARASRLPPLLLQPLVENAIRHGLEPKVDGGSVRIEAEVRNRALHLRVIDDGLGLNAPRRPGPRGAGVALANLRERLAAGHGPRARLTLAAAAGGAPGTCAELVLPLD